METTLLTTTPRALGRAENRNAAVHANSPRRTISFVFKAIENDTPSPHDFLIPIQNSLPSKACDEKPHSHSFSLFSHAPSIRSAGISPAATDGDSEPSYHASDDAASLPAVPL